MPDVVTGAAVYLPLFILLAIAGVAVGLAEWRSRLAHVTAGSPLPATGRYQAQPALAVARVEAARVVRHPIAWLGVVLTVTVTAGGVGWFADPFPGDLLLPIFAPLLIGFFIAVHLGVGRDRHDGMDELAGTLPVGARTRTLGHLLGAVCVAVPVGLALVATVLVYVGGPGGTYREWTPTALELAQPALAMVIVAALAVAAGRWWRHPGAGVFVPLLLFFSPILWGVSLYFQGGPKTVWETDIPLGTITTAHLTWHLVFMLGYLTVVGAAAFLRHDRRPALLVTAAIGLVTVIASYIIKLPPWHWQA